MEVSVLPQQVRAVGDSTQSIPLENGTDNLGKAQSCNG